MFANSCFFDHELSRRISTQMRANDYFMRLFEVTALLLFWFANNKGVIEAKIMFFHFIKFISKEYNI